MTISFPEFKTSRGIPAEMVHGTMVSPAVPHRVNVAPSRRGAYRQVFKRMLDVTAILLSAPVVVPVVAVTAALVASDGGSPFYTQQRVGMGGKAFKIWKLRSMVCDADARMEAYLASDPAAREEWNTTQKLKADPRITKFGKFLRKCSLDELPQLWNVLVGDMSLVGPRPMMINQQHLYPGKAYYALRPGITGYWQTSGRNDTSFESRADFDDAYEVEVSLMTDIKVLAATVGVVVKGTGY